MLRRADLQLLVWVDSGRSVLTRHPLLVGLGMLACLAVVGPAWRHGAFGSAPSLAGVDQHAKTYAVSRSRSASGRLPRIEGALLPEADAPKLLVAADRPFILDTSSGAVRRVVGLRPADGPFSVLGATRAGAVMVSSLTGRVYGVNAFGRRVVNLGVALTAIPDSSGGRIWLLARGSGATCAIRLVSLGGVLLRSARRFSCGFAQAGWPLGIITRRRQIVNPISGRVVFRSRRAILGVAGSSIVQLVQTQTGPRIAVTDLGSRRTHLVSGNVGFVSAEYETSPDGQRVLLWRGGPFVLAASALDVRAAFISLLPGMPARAYFKHTGFAWASNGEVVILAESGGRNIVAVWRPGDRVLRVRRVVMPDRAGERSIAVLSR